MILKNYYFFIIVLLLNTLSYAMDHDENNQNLDTLEFNNWPEEAKENVVIGAASHCDLYFVREFLQHIKGKLSQDGAEHALLLTINKCTTHPDGPAIIKELAKKGVDLNYSSFLTPLHQAAAMANETGDLRVLRALLESGADPDKKGIRSNGEPSRLSSCQMMKILAHKSAQQYAYTRSVANLLNYYGKLCREFNPS